LDVHALSVVAHAIDEETGKVTRARLCPDHGEVLGWLHQLRGPVRVTYEAGPTGFGLARAINNSAGMECLVAAPSKLQRPAGDRVKTDAKDAAHLARLLRLSEITAVTVPAPEIEAVRDLVRARDDARADLMRVRHRLSKLLLRQGIVYSGGTPWTCVHESWLRKQRFADHHLKAAFDHSFDAVLAATAARNRLDEQILDVAASARFADPVNRLGCLRGISALTGLALTVEIGDWSRFTGSSIGAYVGLVPSEFSSGTSRVQGSITKAGNTHVRRLLIEAAWHHRKSYSTSGPESAGAMGQGGSRAARPRSRRQPAPLQQVAGIHRAEEEPSGGQRCGRPRVVGLVLVAGHHVKRQPQRLGWPGEADVGAVSEPTCREPMSHNAIRPRSTVTLVCRQQ
jgi:transposase